MQEGVMVVLGLVLGAMLIFGLYLCIDFLSTARSCPQVLPINQRHKYQYGRGREDSIECVADLEEQCVGSNTTVRENSVARLNNRIAEVRASNASVAFQTRPESQPITFGSEAIALQDLPPIIEAKPASFGTPFEDQVSPRTCMPSVVEPADSSYNPWSRFPKDRNACSKDYRNSKLGKVSRLKVVSTSGDALLVPNVCGSHQSSRIAGASSARNGNPSVINFWPAPSQGQGKGFPGPPRDRLDEQFEDVDLDEPSQQPQRKLSRWENPRTAPSPPGWQLPDRDIMTRFSRHQAHQ